MPRTRLVVVFLVELCESGCATRGQFSTDAGEEDDPPVSDWHEDPSRYEGRDIFSSTIGTFERSRFRTLRMSDPSIRHSSVNPSPKSVLYDESRSSHREGWKSGNLEICRTVARTPSDL